ncbi:MAG: site-specific DNA-methyltransferase [Bacteroidetes bacterium]|nr:site-specific DNA-methyltransferase [Bacteroidota bacterium]
MELNKIYNESNMITLGKMPNCFLDLIVTSPPYNKGYYGKHTPNKSDTWKQRNISYGEFKDNLHPDEYIRTQKELLAELVRVLKPNGSIFYNTKAVIFDHRLVYPTFVFDFNVRQQIIWDRRASPQISPIRFLPTTEYIFWITKTNVQPKFKLIGKNKSEVWNIPADSNTDHPAPFTAEIPRQCIMSATDEGDLVYDPYMGIGTTALAAIKYKRNWIGSEINSDYCQKAETKISEAMSQTFLF